MALQPEGPGLREAGSSCAAAQDQQRAREPRDCCSRQTPAQEAGVGRGEDPSLQTAEQLGPLITRIGSGRASRGLRALSHFPRNQIPRAGGRGGGCASLLPGAGQDWDEAKTRSHRGGARAAGCRFLVARCGSWRGHLRFCASVSSSIKRSRAAPFPCIRLLAKQAMNLWKTLQIVSTGPRRDGPALRQEAASSQPS